MHGSAHRRSVGSAAAAAGSDDTTDGRLRQRGVDAGGRYGTSRAVATYVTDELGATVTAPALSAPR